MCQSIEAVVVDGGGSGCRLGAFDANGTLCAAASDGPASLSLGEEQTWRHIRRGLSTLARQMGESEDWLPGELCMGLSGALQTERAERFMALLPSGLKYTLVSDGHAQLLGASGGHPGVCLAIGTGSVIHWLDRSGTVGMAGGWGFPMGDQGSGAWLGAKLITAYLQYRDDPKSHHTAPLIFSTLEGRIGLDVSDVQAWSTSVCSTQLATLVPMIVAAAEQGDPLSASLLSQGVRECEKLLSYAPPELPVYVVGGLADIYRTRFDPSVQIKIQTPAGDVFNGLYRLSLAYERNNS